LAMRGMVPIAKMSKINILGRRHVAFDRRLSSRIKLLSKLIYILNGPNLNLLGTREPEVYGHTTLEQVAQNCADTAKDLGLTTSLLQSNHEGELVDWVQEAEGKAAGIIINPAAFSHTSVAILDALNMFPGPVIEVHISNIYKREEFRHHSFVSARANGIIAGCGVEGYSLAVRHMASLLED